MNVDRLSEDPQPSWWEEYTQKWASLRDFGASKIEGAPYVPSRMEIGLLDAVREEPVKFTTDELARLKFLRWMNDQGYFSDDSYTTDWRM